MHPKKLVLRDRRKWWPLADIWSLVGLWSLYIFPLSPYNTCVCNFLALYGVKKCRPPTSTYKYETKHYLIRVKKVRNWNFSRGNTCKITNLSIKKSWKTEIDPTVHDREQFVYDQACAYVQHFNWLADYSDLNWKFKQELSSITNHCQFGCQITSRETNINNWIHWIQSICITVDGSVIGNYKYHF